MSSGCCLAANVWVHLTNKKRKMTDFLGGSSTGRRGTAKLQTALEIRISLTCVSCMILHEPGHLPCTPVRLLHRRVAARSLLP